MDNFKPLFRKALRQVHARYKAARIEIDGYGHAAAQQPAAGHKAAGDRCPAHNPAACS